MKGRPPHSRPTTNAATAGAQSLSRLRVYCFSRLGLILSVRKCFHRDRKFLCFSGTRGGKFITIDTKYRDASRCTRDGTTAFHCTRLPRAVVRGVFPQSGILDLFGINRETNDEYDPSRSVRSYRISGNTSPTESAKTGHIVEISHPLRKQPKY